MRIRYSQRFLKQYQRLREGIKKKVDKQLRFLASDLRHPSIRAKKIEGVKNIWEGRIDKNYRFTFKIQKGEIVLRNVDLHDKTLRRP